MGDKVILSEAEERKRKARMTSRLCALFIVLDLTLFGVIVFELLQLFSLFIFIFIFVIPFKGFCV